ncbi:G-type lectin S-receptor-like serine/threonine-protein kinase [Citrus sinensis]|uniref:G-type lectin S-receptor-like serine/threonine-protein kinase n=1 Tax=Citrus sinensis TaxID=2711 RepID=A0ACB8NZT7_CITSI|nr:G-type lectin S-receptor-like serine/threonine-protein kinase [Citrus sinensis]
MDVLSFPFICCKLLFFLSESSFASDTITSSQSLSDGRTLVSKEGSFELGFFSPGSSKNRYVGIWYKNMPVQTVVWVANRINPINDSSGMLVVNETGNLVLTSQNKSVVWSANLSKEVRTPVVLQLLDSGNLVLRGERDGGSETYLWQSFDYPSDTLLPGMKLGWDLKTGLERRITSWKSPDDPSPGNFTWALERQDNPESIFWKGSRKLTRSGPWNGLRFSDKVVFSRTLVNQTLSLRQRFVWSKATQSWELYTSVPIDQCDTYALCGAYGICIISYTPFCQCLIGFKPKSRGYVDWSQGCVRDKSLNYSRQDGFIKFTAMKLPDSTSSWVSKSMNLNECREKCLDNSSCMAYTNSDIRGEGSGCAMWFGDLIDITYFQDGGQDLYIRMSASELGAKGVPTTKIVVIVISTAALLAVVIAASYLVHKRRRNIVEKTENDQIQNIDLELPLFELATIVSSTNNFSINMKLGQGGFGPVYKGTLVDGQEIAVKRLSKISEQGLKELKNEVILFSKLQHKNLVKLLGCCIQGEEKLLIYEFMPNKSLDSFIFAQEICKILDWSKRFHIICGTARGVMYLHQDSRLRIVHRDLKASNVLLDQDMNPKISDFGLARAFGGDETEGNTNRVVGTYGYMAPEYASGGQFSVKSDVFSFGILLLEIISGKKNRGFYHSDNKLNLIGHAWKLWNEGMPSQLIDPCIQGSFNLAEVIRCIHIGLLCVQQHPKDMPSMPSVILMLGSETVLPQPKQPGYLADRKSTRKDYSSSTPESCSTNTITISELEGRGQANFAADYLAKNAGSVPLGFHVYQEPPVGHDPWLCYEMGQ